MIIRENQEIELTYTEFEIFKLLAKHPGIVFSRNGFMTLCGRNIFR